MAAAGGRTDVAERGGPCGRQQGSEALSGSLI